MNMIVRIRGNIRIQSSISTTINVSIRVNDYYITRFSISLYYEY